MAIGSKAQTPAAIQTPVLIIGGGVGGVAAALSCIRLGVACTIVEPTDWLGGQLTSQAVPPDENQWVETFGATASYQQLRQRVRASAIAAGAVVREVEPFGTFNPGGGWVSRCCAEPARWHTEIMAMLREALSAKGDAKLLSVMINCELLGVGRDRDRIGPVRIRDTSTGQEHTIEATMYLDATELGDVLALGQIEHHIGAEHQSVYDELHGRTDFDATISTHDQLDQQACSWCFAVEHKPGENHTISKPPGYDFWASYIPQMTPKWCGELFSWTVPSHNEEGKRFFNMVPWPDEPPSTVWEMWRYRRIVDCSIWPGHLAEAHPDVSLVNMVQMDYWQRPLLGVTAHAQALALAGAREQSLCWLYWMQSQAPRHDGGTGYSGLKLRGNELGTDSGMAKACYIREPRRLVARTTMTERHIGTQQRKAAGLDTPETNWEATPYGTAEKFADSVGIGHYSIDLHPSCAGRNNVYVPAAPYRIPMGSLIAIRCRNVLASGKCLGVSHIVNGTTRMHHSEWNIGEAAGALAAYCVQNHTEPQAVHVEPEKVEAVQRLLAELGVRLAWPWEK